VHVERRKKERREETEARRKTWQERFAERSDSHSAAAPDTQEAGRKRSGLPHLCGLQKYCSGLILHLVLSLLLEIIVINSSAAA